MVRDRFDNLEPARQEAILSVAADEFAEHGYTGASVNRIIEAANMSKGSLYYYFDDKADLFSTVVERAVTRFVEESGWLNLDDVAADDFWEALLERTHRAMEITARNTWWVRIGMAYQRFQGEATNEAAVRRLVDLGRDYWGRLIRRGQELGVIRTDLPLGLLVETVLGADHGGDRWMFEHWDTFSPDELNAVVDGRVDLLRDMLDKKNEGWES